MPAPEAAAPSAAPSTSASIAVTPDDRASSFRAAENGGEAVSGGTLLVAAYAVMLAVLMLTVLRVFLRQSEVGKKVEQLDAALREARAKADAK